jgi:hypothetical protein
VRAPGRCIPDALDRAIVRALEKSPDDRFASAAAMREALEGALRAPEKSRSRARKRNVAIAVCTVIVAATAGASQLVGSRQSNVGETPIAEATRAFEPDVTLGLPLPSPPTATAALSAAMPPPAESSAANTSASRTALALPPLPVAKDGALADVSRATGGRDTKPDPEHVRKAHGHSLATLTGIETVSHKIRR